MNSNFGKGAGIVAGAALAVSAASPVVAQDSGGGDLLSLGVASLRGEISRRYDEALAMTRDAAVVSADTNSFMWASQAKIQCGIAMGFLKSGTKDPVSVGKCDDAYRRMQYVPPAPPPPLAPPPPICAGPLAGTIFFDWDVAIPPRESEQTLDSIVSAMASCNWTRLTVTGHTDRSGSETYNQALSVQRAGNVADVLAQKGIARDRLEVAGRGETEPKVPTLDGERNPQNRRVEVTVEGAEGEGQ